MEPSATVRSLREDDDDEWMDAPETSQRVLLRYVGRNRASACGMRTVHGKFMITLHLK